MAASDAGGDGAAKEGAGAPQDLVLKVLGAVGTGIGVLGFVAFFGGAILWLRAERAGLPANDAVSAIPNSVLVTTGANFLVPALLIALLAVVAIFAVFVVGNLRRQEPARHATEAAKSLREEAESLRAEAKTKREKAESAAATLAQAQGNPAVATAAMAETQSFGDESRADLRAAEKKEAAAKDKEHAAKGTLTHTPFQFRVELWVGFLAVLILPPILNQAIFSSGFWPAGVILFGVAVAAATASAVVYLSTQKLVWFGIAAFVTVGVYIGTATYYSTTHNVKVEPAAALRGEKAPVVGSFIADTASNLYFGTFPEEPGTPHLIVIPRAQVTALSIGGLTAPTQAPNAAVGLALEECRRLVDVPKTKEEKAHEEPTCTAPQRATLRAELR